MSIAPSSFRTCYSAGAGDVTDAQNLRGLGPLWGLLELWRCHAESHREMTAHLVVGIVVEDGVEAAFDGRRVDLVDGQEARDGDVVIVPVNQRHIVLQAELDLADF